MDGLGRLDKILRVDLTEGTAQIQLMDQMRNLKLIERHL